MSETDACAEAEVDRFLRKGICESSFDVDWGGEGGGDEGDEYADDIEDDEFDEKERSDEVSDTETSAPDCERLAPCCLCISPKYLSVNLKASSCPTPAKATTILSGWKNVLRYLSTTFLLIYCRRSCGQRSGFPSVLSLYAAMLTSSGKIRSGFDHISRISYSAVSSCCWTSRSVMRGSRIVSARRPKVVGTAELKLAD